MDMFFGFPKIKAFTLRKCGPRSIRCRFSTQTRAFPFSHFIFSVINSSPCWIRQWRAISVCMSPIFVPSQERYLWVMGHKPLIAAKICRLVWWLGENLNEAGFTKIRFGRWHGIFLFKLRTNYIKPKAPVVSCYKIGQSVCNQADITSHQLWVWPYGGSLNFRVFGKTSSFYIWGQYNMT